MDGRIGTKIHCSVLKALIVVTDGKSNDPVHTIIIHLLLLKALIVVTDGKSNDPVHTIKEAANKWKQRGVKTYALGFGSQVDTDGKH